MKLSPNTTCLLFATLFATLFGAALAAGPALAQDKPPEKVLREGQLTQQGLIEALTPRAAPTPAPAIPAGPAGPAGPAAPTTDEAASAPEGAASAVRTRGFRPMVRPAAAAVASTAAAAAQPARASILVTFVTNSADLTPGAKKALDVLASAMKSEKLAGVKFVIEGHADPRGGDEVNLKLSQSRAEAVREYLTTSQGLAPDRVTAVGKGSSALMNTADPAAPENRRVTIVAQPG